jgi:cytochrome c biogenesis protein CcmG/thiol:disulfide interchange protein DsbE
MTLGRKRLVQLAAAGVVAALAAVLVRNIVDSGGGVAAKLDQGRPVAAPPLVLDELGGKGSVSLASYRGKAVVVNYWASWCVPCKEEAPVLERTWRSHRSAGLVVLGVDANDFSKDASRFVRKHGLTYPVAVDPHGSTLGRWGVPGLPTTFVVDRRGRVIGKVLGGIGSGEKLEDFERLVARALA